MVSAAAGSQLHGLGLVQYGGELGGQETYRLFASSFDIGNGTFPSGSLEKGLRALKREDEAFRQWKRR